MSAAILLLALQATHTWSMEVSPFGSTAVVRPGMRAGLGVRIINNSSTRWLWVDQATPNLDIAAGSILKSFRGDRWVFPAVGPKSSRSTPFDPVNPAPAGVDFVASDYVAPFRTLQANVTFEALWVDRDPYANPRTFQIIESAGAKTVRFPIVTSDGLMPIAMQVNPTSVVGGNPVSATFTLEGSPPNPEVYTLSSSVPSVASVPSSLAVSGSPSGSFTVTTSPVSRETLVLIRVNRRNAIQTAELRLLPPSLISLVASATSIYAGQTFTLRANLNGKAPSGGMAVTLSDNSAYVATPSSVTVPANATNGSISCSTLPVTRSITVTLTAKLGAVTKSDTIRIDPTLKSLRTAVTTMRGGSSTTGTVELEGGCVAASSVTLRSSSANLMVSSPLSVPANTLRKGFPIQSRVVSAAGNATVTATLGVTSRTATIRLTP